MGFLKRKTRPRTKAIIERDNRQLRRLETLTDVLFALVLFRIFMILPSLGKIGSGEGISITRFFSENLGGIEIIFIGVLLVLIYCRNTIKDYGTNDQTK